MRPTSPPSSRTQSGEAALVELARLRDSNSYVLSNCHTLAHAIGHADLVRYGTINEAVKHADGTCWSGSIHGVYEKYMSQFDDEQLISSHPDALRAASRRPLRVRLLQLPARHRARGHDPLRQRPVPGPSLLRLPRGGLAADELLHGRVHAEHRRRPSDAQLRAARSRQPGLSVHRGRPAVQEGLLPDTDLVHPACLRLRLREGVRGLRRRRGRVRLDLLRQHGPRHQRQLAPRRRRRWSSAAPSATPNTRAGASSAQPETPSSTTTARRTPTRSARSFPCNTAPTAKAPAIAQPVLCRT